MLIGVWLIRDTAKRYDKFQEMINNQKLDTVNVYSPEPTTDDNDNNEEEI